MRRGGDSLQKYCPLALLIRTCATQHQKVWACCGLRRHFQFSPLPHLPHCLCWVLNGELSLATARLLWSNAVAVPGIAATCHAAAPAGVLRVCMYILMYIYRILRRGLAVSCTIIYWAIRCDVWLLQPSEWWWPKLWHVCEVWIRSQLLKKCHTFLYQISVTFWAAVTLLHTEPRRCIAETRLNYETLRCWFTLGVLFSHFWQQAKQAPCIKLF
jgi:hypothetical protein